MSQQDIYGELSKYGDCDNRWDLVGFANRKVVTTHLGRTLTNGFEGMTGVCGTKGHSIVNGNSTMNRVEVQDSYGVRTATIPDAFALYGNSFINDLAEFAGAILDNEPLTCNPDDAYEAAKIATALQYSSATACLSILTTMAFPPFNSKYGELQPSGSYQVPARWQTGISNGAQCGEIIGLLRTSSLYVSRCHHY